MSYSASDYICGPVDHVLDQTVAFKFNWNLGSVTNICLPRRLLPSGEVFDHFVIVRIRLVPVFLCICPLIAYKLRHSFVKVAVDPKTSKYMQRGKIYAKTESVCSGQTPYQPFGVAYSHQRSWIRNQFTMEKCIWSNRRPCDVTVFVPRFQFEAWFYQLGVSPQFQMHFLSERVQLVMPLTTAVYVPRLTLVERVGHEVAIWIWLVWLGYYILGYYRNEVRSKMLKGVLSVISG